MNLELLLGTEVWQQTNLKLNQLETGLQRNSNTKGG